MKPTWDNGKMSMKNNKKTAIVNNVLYGKF